MKRKLSIAIAGNTAVPALHALRSKRYAVSLSFERRDDGLLDSRYEAVRDGRHFFATSPEELLGLVAMWEIRGDEWRATGGERGYYEALLAEASIFDSEGNEIAEEAGERA